MVQLRRLSLGLWGDSLNLVTKISFWAFEQGFFGDGVNARNSAFIPLRKSINVDPWFKEIILLDRYLCLEYIEHAISFNRLQFEF
ncbi:uncharacterized protein LACBIDRAFT_303780 [Laccaria bicolor S238N-H82]|uniref:Predicted protein n=1 Tax=Laccaria bicolor (strain S238N-H82 / ATCC MYA-4686) TaxID=486041 RepID=B0DKA7_LACBS|nr:uncharacterized protein LACBIDRAFT_303780 [Laccaria bicolor S238N-H82]EDR04909.1 predicted protein [Laccaria bicolor S238N-H82]|eukprot:XP_001884299.1 predicted protein [Laccaria bicolor S238N-H82]